MQIGRITINKYKCRWNNIGRKHHAIRTRILHGCNLQNVKKRAILLYGSIPSMIMLLN